MKFYQQHTVDDVGRGGILTLQEFGLDTLPDDVASSGKKLKSFRLFSQYPGVSV